VLQSGGMTARELRVLQERGWDAYQRLLRRTSSKGRSKCKARRWGSGKQQEMEEQLELDRLEGVVVVEAEEKPAEQAMIGHPRQAAEPAAAAAAGVPVGAGAAAAPPAAAAAAVDLEAGVGAPQQQQITSEEQDGVLHTTHLSCRQRGSRKCQTICTLLNRRPAAAVAAAAAHAAEPAAPELDAPPATPQPLQLRVIAEEEGEEEEEEQPPSPAASSPQQRRRRRGPWERLVSHHPACSSRPHFFGLLGGDLCTSRAALLCLLPAVSRCTAHPGPLDHPVCSLPCWGWASCPPAHPLPWAPRFPPGLPWEPTPQAHPPHPPPPPAPVAPCMMPQTFLWCWPGAAAAACTAAAALSMTARSRRRQQQQTAQAAAEASPGWQTVPLLRLGSARCGRAS
jgi:hypothetical protein